MEGDKSRNANMTVRKGHAETCFPVYYDGRAIKMPGGKNQEKYGVCSTMADKTDVINQDGTMTISMTL